MKTEQILERDFYDGRVRQRHQSRLFSANDLFDIYRSHNPTTKKTLQNYFALQSTKELVDTLEHVERIPANQVMDVRLGKRGGTWVHAYVLIDLAMWLDTSFKVRVLGWVYDNLCYLRDAAGDDFKDLMQTIKDEIEPEKHWIYTNEIRLIQGLAGVDAGERNSASQDALHKLEVLQKADIKMIKQGIHDYNARKKKLIALAEML